MIVGGAGDFLYGDFDVDWDGCVLELNFEIRLRWSDVSGGCCEVCKLILGC